MKQLIFTVIIVALMDSTSGQCISCSDGSMLLSPLSYNTMRSNVFNGTQPSNEGCTNGVSIGGQVTIDCEQGTTLIDCDRGFNGGDYSDLSRTFAWNRTNLVAQQVSIVFRFDQQINISRITMFFWNSLSNSIIIPSVRMYQGNYFDGSNVLTNQITITTNSPSRTGDGRRRLFIDINDNGLQFQYLRIVMNFYDNSDWIFLGGVQFCGNTAPFHITQPSTDNDVQIVSPTATMASMTCSLNITIPSDIIIVWNHNGNIATAASNKNAIQTSHGTTLLIENPQSSDAGVYQCTFIDTIGSGWVLRRNIRLVITVFTTATVSTTTVNPTVTSTTTIGISTTTTTANVGTTTASTTTTSVVTSTTTNTTVNTTTATDATTPSSSTNVGAIVASVVVVVLLFIAIVIMILILVFFWRKKQKNYHVYDDATELSKQPPSYVNLLSKQKGNAYTDGTPAGKNIEDNQTPSLVYAVPNKRERKEKRKSAELQKRMSIEFNYRPQRSPEMSVRSRKQTLSLINPDYDQAVDLDIYATAPKIPERTEVSHHMVSDDTDDNAIYSEAISPTAIETTSSHDYSSVNDNLYPYTSIYADPLPLVKSEGPPIVFSRNIKPLHQLGIGQFGEVILAETVGLSYQDLGIGNSNDSTISMKVAVKTLKSSPSEDVQKAFEKEIKFMSRLKDDNVIKLLGICTTGTPFIMMEYMENGDLNNYLKKFEFTYETEKQPAANEITLNALVYISFQIANGMKYLSSRKFIHRDLAARNILVGTDYVVKIADFGMSQNLYSAYYCKVGGSNVLPIRWMASECFYGKFSVQTDVWAFGITLWEIFTLCQELPFENLFDQEMINDAIKGPNRSIPDQPEICPDDIYYIMKSCWRHEPSERARFSLLCDQLNEYYSNIL